MWGKAEDGLCGQCSGQLAGGEDGGVEGLCCLVIGDEDKRGRVRGADEQRKIQRAGSEGEAGDASSPAAGTQVATDTIEGDRVLKVRQQLADERQNHKLS